MDSKDLLLLLEQINGVYFTGGSILQINPVTGEQHQYYKTAKKIMEYSMLVKDRRKQEFPILGLCMGFQIMIMVASGDVKELRAPISQVDV